MAPPSTTIDETDYAATTDSTSITLTDDAYGITIAIKELTGAITSLTRALRGLR